MRIVAFNGLARGGKTTCAEILEKWCVRHGMHPIRCSFADPMKKAARYVGLSKDDNPKLYRATLQRWGENKRNPEYQPGRSGPHYWITRVQKMIMAHAIDERNRFASMSDHGLDSDFKESILIFDDLRYGNELDLVRKMNGITVFVDGVSRIKDLGADWRQHESELLSMAITFGVIDGEIFDYYLPNDGSKERLEQLVDKLAPAWLDHDWLCSECGGHE